MSAELNALIRVVAAEHPQSDIRELARFVAKMTPQESVMGFYTEALVGLVGEVIGQERRDAFNGPERKGRSAKLDDRRSWWKELLASRVHVGGGEWLCIADCTGAELDFCIEERRSQIAGFERQITNFERLISLMVKHGAKTVKDLPAQSSWPS